MGEVSSAWSSLPPSPRRRLRGLHGPVKADGPPPNRRSLQEVFTEHRGRIVQFGGVSFVGMMADHCPAVFHVKLLPSRSALALPPPPPAQLRLAPPSAAPSHPGPVRSRPGAE